VWLVVTLVTTFAVIAFVAALARQTQILGRTAKQLGREAGPVVDEISRLGARASERASRLQSPRRSDRERESG
jgi:hypothetical protein